MQILNTIASASWFSDILSYFIFGNFWGGNEFREAD